MKLSPLIRLAVCRFVVSAPMMKPTAKTQTTGGDDEDPSYAGEDEWRWISR